MSAARGPILEAICRQFASTLAAYERDLALLVATPGNAELHGSVGAHMDLMRMYVSALPSLSVAWVELMIRHFELAQGLRRVQQHGTGAADLELLRTETAFAIDHLTRKCGQLLPAGK